jgi:hypothetical protein
MRRQVDTYTLEMALIGCHSQLSQITERIREIRKRLGRRAAQGGAGDMATSFRGKRNLSAAARERIAAAQRKRWAAFHEKYGAGAKKPATNRRTFSPEAKAKLAANLAKARAARAAKRAAGT